MCYMDVGLRKVPWGQISDAKGRCSPTTVGVRKLGDLGVTYALPFIARWKSRGRLPIRHN